MLKKNYRPSDSPQIPAMPEGFEAVSSPAWTSPERDWDERTQNTWKSRVSGKFAINVPLLLSVQTFFPTWYLFNTYLPKMSWETALRTLQIVSYLIFLKLLGDGLSHHPYYTDQETEAQSEWSWLPSITRLAHGRTDIRTQGWNFEPRVFGSNHYTVWSLLPNKFLHYALELESEKEETDRE